MANPNLGGTDIPEAIRNGEEYKFEQPTIVNGAGERVATGYARVTWTFRVMTKTNYQWITNTLLGGAQSNSYASAQLYDDNFTLQTYTGAVAHKPTARTYKGGMVIDVTWVIDGLT